MKRLLSRSLAAISCIVLAVAPINKIRSCGPGYDPDDARFMLFRHELTDKSLSAFHYSSHYMYGSVADPMETDIHRNCAEWVAVAGNKVKEKDVYIILYKTRPEEFMYAYNNGKWEALEDNAFMQWLRKKENQPYLQYMSFARKIEYDQLGDKDPWMDNSNPGSINNDSLANMALAKCNEPVSQFLTQRYAFQAEKLFYYSGVSYRVTEHTPLDKQTEVAAKNLTACYDTYLKGKNTVVADWGLLYYALSQANKTTRTRYLLQTFDQSVEKRIFIYNYLSVKEVQELEHQTTDAQELELINVYKAIRNPGRALDEIKEVCKYNPESKYLPLLVSREVNKLEDWLLSAPQLGFDLYGKKNFEKDMQYLDEVCKYLAAFADTRRSNKDFMRVALIHLYHTKGDYATARKYLDQGNQFSDPDLEIQYNIEQFISLINTRDIGNDAVRNELNNTFVRLEKAGLRTDTSGEYDYSMYDRKKDVMSELYVMLSNKFKGQGDIVAGGLAMRKSKTLVNTYHGADWYEHIAWLDKYASPADVDALLRLKEKKNKTPFEQRLCSVEWGDEYMYKDVKATILLRQGHYDAALAIMNTMPEDYWQKNYEFKDYLRRRSVTSVGTMLPIANGRNEKYPLESKKLILADILAVRAAIPKATTDSARAQLYFMLGNCMYNISYHGKDWMMFSYGKTANEWDSHGADYAWAYFTFYPNDLKFGTMYYECTEAIKMYTEALKYTGKHKELAAQCLLMLSTCDNAATSYRFQHNRAEGNYSSQPAYYSPYLGLLKKDYKQTEIYGRSTTECPDVEAYVNKFGG